MTLLRVEFALLPAIASPAMPRLTAMAGPLTTDSRVALPTAKHEAPAASAPQPLASSLSAASAPDPATSSAINPAMDPGVGGANGAYQTSASSAPAAPAQNGQAALLTPAFLLAALSFILGLTLLTLHLRLRKRIHAALNSSLNQPVKKR